MTVRTTGTGPGGGEPNGPEPPEPAPNEPAAPQPRPDEGRPGEPRPDELRSGELRPGELRSVELRPDEFRPGERRPGELRTDQRPPGEFGPGELRPSGGVPADGSAPSLRAGTVLAIDGGNSKTDVLLVDSGGAVIASGRSGGFTPQSSGVGAAIAVAAEAVGLIRAELGLPPGVPLARHLAAYVAGADLPVEEEALAVAFAAEGWADSVEVGNDTFALLRAGASRSWGVAVVCGAGINCAGIGPDGGRARFPSLGRLTGDWGGGHHLGEEALWHAVRAEDGRGPATALCAAVAGHFGRPTVEDVALAVHFGEIANDRLGELAPVLMRVATDGDPVAVSLVDRMADEVVTMARVVLTRLRIADRPAEVVLGGGVLRARAPVLMDRITARAAAQIPLAELVVAADSPVVGAALLGLDTLRRAAA